MNRRRRLWSVMERYFNTFRKSQRRTICELALGLLQRGQVGLAAIARGMDSSTSVRHRIKRVWRFARNEGVRVEKATLCLVQWITCLGAGELVVGLDWTHMGDYVLLAAKALVARRALPLAWLVMVKGQFDGRRKSRNAAEEELVLRLRQALGDYPWILVADRGFARGGFLKKLKQWDIRFVIRACGSTWIETGSYEGRIDSLPRRPGRLKRYQRALYHKSLKVPVSLLLSHREPAPEPWYLLTNIEDTRRAANLYRRRMWIEQAFRDMKTNLGISKLWLALPERVERLLIIVAVVMVLAVVVALHWRQEHGQKDPQLSTRRRGSPLSVFRMGLELIRAFGLPPGIARLRLSIAELDS